MVFGRLFRDKKRLIMINILWSRKPLIAVMEKESWLSFLVRCLIGENVRKLRPGDHE